jgi:hypothetical protein
MRSNLAFVYLTTYTWIRETLYTLDFNLFVDRHPSRSPSPFGLAFWTHFNGKRMPRAMIVKQLRAICYGDAEINYALILLWISLWAFESRSFIHSHGMFTITYLAYFG